MRKGKKKTKYNVERLVAVGLGSAAALGSNMLINQITASLDEEKKATLRKVSPLLKAGVGYLLISEVDEQMVNDFGLGMIAGAAAEGAMTYFPEYIQISGVAGFWGDEGGFYSDIGSMYSELPLDAMGSRLLDEGPADDHAVMGYDYERGEALDMTVS
ncbi:MAG: hypothetical protein AAFW73_26270 [Bacteroidota bacterium]